MNDRQGPSDAQRKRNVELVRAVRAKYAEDAGLTLAQVELCIRAGTLKECGNLDIEYRLDYWLLKDEGAPADPQELFQASLTITRLMHQTPPVDQR